MMEGMLGYYGDARTASHSALPAGAVRGVVMGTGGGRPVDPEAAHLEAAGELLHRHGLSLADCRVSRECAGAEAGDAAVLYVVRVGVDVDAYALNEALTAMQLARGLTPSAQLDVVFES